MKRVVIESPYFANSETETVYNILYAQKCVADSLSRNEAPIASHLLYTQPGILNDAIPNQRQKGIDAGFAWNAMAQLIAVYTDRGISSGMLMGIIAAKKLNIPIEYREIGK